MDSKDFSNMIHQLSENLIQALPVINEKVALNAHALMRNRRLNDGTIGENKPLGEYSDNPLPAWWFIGKSVNKGGDKELIKTLKKEKKSGEFEGISYKKWREANNRPTDHVTGNFTGTTDADTGVTKTITNGTSVETVVGAKNTKTRANGKTTSQILSYLGDMYGDYLQPNKAEEQILNKSLNAEVDKIIKKSFK